MATLPTSGNITATQIRNHFGQTGNFEITDYYRGGGIVPATRGGGGGMQEITTLTATGSVANPQFTDPTDIYERSDFRARLGRGSRGADNITDTGHGTWGIYPANSDYTQDGGVDGISISSTALTLNAQYDLLFNREDGAGDSLETQFLAFRSGDAINITRNAGLTNAGNGYQFTLVGTPSLNDGDGDGRNVVLLMSVRVSAIIGTGILNDALTISTDLDTLSVVRPGVAATSPVVRFTFDSSISPSTLDVTLPFGNPLTVTQQEQAFVDAFNAHGAFTATLRQTANTYLLRGGSIGTSTRGFVSDFNQTSVQTLGAFPSSGTAIFRSDTTLGAQEIIDIGNNLGITLTQQTSPGTPVSITNGSTVRFEYTNDGSTFDATIIASATYDVTRVLYTSNGFYVEVDATTVTGITGSPRESNTVVRSNFIRPERATTITNNVAGAVDDMTFIINGGTPGLTNAAYTLTVTQQGSAATPTYPATGGIALDDIGSDVMNNNNFYSWPTTAATLQGQTGDFTYNAGNGSTGNDTSDGSIVNNTGTDIEFNTINITCRVTYTDRPAAVASTFNPFFWVRTNTQNVVGAPQVVATLNNQEVYSISNGSGTWANGQAMQFRMFTNVPANTPFSYTIDHLRVNLNSNSEEFLPSGTGGTTDINTDIPESGNIVYTDFYGADNGDDDSTQRAAPEYDGAEELNLTPPPGPND